MFELNSCGVSGGALYRGSGTISIEDYGFKGNSVTDANGKKEQKSRTYKMQTKELCINYVVLTELDT